jgi:hypothetical protein
MLVTRMVGISAIQPGVRDELVACSNATLPMEFSQGRAWRFCLPRRGDLLPPLTTGRIGLDKKAKDSSERRRVARFALLTPGASWS